MRARASTWNVAAINNNPFEYYASARGRGEASSDDGGDVYETFLLAVERALSSDAGGASRANACSAKGAAPAPEHVQAGDSADCRCGGRRSQICGGTGRALLHRGHRCHA